MRYYPTTNTVEEIAAEIAHLNEMEKLQKLHEFAAECYDYITTWQTLELGQTLNETMRLKYAQELRDTFDRLGSVREMLGLA